MLDGFYDVSPLALGKINPVAIQMKRDPCLFGDTDFVVLYELCSIC